MASYEPTLLERFGIASLRRLGRPPIPSDDPIHFLNDEERARLARLEIAGIAKATAAGAASSLATVVASYYAGAPAAGFVRYWTIVIVVTVVASLLELLYLYIDGVKTVAEMALAAGLEISEGAINESIALGLARAALELPSPPESRLGVSAHQESNRIALVTASLLYKAKVTITNFALKILLRRALGRAAGASVIFVAVPVTAVWNGIVAFKIFREARLRIVGSTSAPLLVDFIGERENEGELALRAIACITVQSARVHPSVEALAEALIARHGSVTPSRGLGNSEDLVALLAGGNRETRRMAVRAATVAAILDGKITAREERLLKRLASLAEVELPLDGIRALSRNLVFGSGLEERRLAELAVPLGLREEPRQLFASA